MSPILVRPVREQLEHDRVIRQLQAKFRRKYEVGINPAGELNVPVGTGSAPIYPDVVLMAMDRGRRVQCVVEVETGESVNHLEALAQWAHLSRTRVPFHLYVPAGMVDVARRLSEDNNIHVAEIWSYHSVGDQMRFTMAFRNKETPPPVPKKPTVPKEPKAVAATGGNVKKAAAGPGRKTAVKKPIKKKKKK
ncbi:MAG TPA: hypothetical protein VMS04_16590 [Vicinamibacterales bacterium]|nr:hypothetical protein [Vicinamibacterales bacterium]